MVVRCVQHFVGSAAIWRILPLLLASCEAAQEISQTRSVLVWESTLVRPERTVEFRRPAGTKTLSHRPPGTSCRANFLRSLRDQKPLPRLNDNSGKMHPAIWRIQSLTPRRTRRSNTRRTGADTDGLHFTFPTAVHLVGEVGPWLRKRMSSISRASWLLGLSCRARCNCSMASGTRFNRPSAWPQRM